MVEFVYNNAKNASIGYMLFEVNCEYYLYIFYKEEKIFDFCSKSKPVEELSFELYELMIIYQQNLYYV